MKYLFVILILFLPLVVLSCGDNPGNSPPSESPLVPDVDSMQGFALTNAVFLSWVEPNDDIYEIKIEYARSSKGDEKPAAQKTDGLVENGVAPFDVIMLEPSEEEDFSGNCIVDELENGISYTFTVRTVDADGNVSKGVSCTATPSADSMKNILSVAAMDKSVHLDWSSLKGVPLTEKKIEYGKIGNDDMLEGGGEITPGNDTNSHTVENLSNGTEYEFRFSANIDARNKKFPVITTVHCVPLYFETNPDTERAVAIKYEGKVFLSWTYKGQNIFGNDLVFPKSVNVYINDTFYENIKPVSMNEEVNPDQSNNEISIYDAYFVYTVDFEKYDDLSLRAVNENGAVANALTLPPAKEVFLPIVDIRTENLVPIGEGYESSKKEKKIPSTLSLFNCDENTRLQDVNLTVKGRGNSSWENAPKKSYTLKFAEKNGILGMKKHKSWALVANYFDKTLLRNVTAYELGRMVYDNMAWTPSAKSVHLFMNGVYEGIYAFTETNKIDTNRVNIKNLEDYAQAGGDFYDYGYLLEANERADENFNFETNQPYQATSSADKDKKLVFSLKEPDGKDITEDLRQKIKEEVLKREAALFSSDFSDTASENYWKKYFHEDSFIDWWIVSEFACNTDSNYYSSCYVYYEPRDGLFHAGPLWDFDLGFGNMKDLVDTKKMYTVNGVWLKRMFEDVSFKEKAYTRWTEKLPALRDYLSGSYAENLAAVKKDVELNFRRWPIIGKNTWKAPSDFEDRKTYDDEVDYFKNWCDRRQEWLSQWLFDSH